MAANTLPGIGIDAQGNQAVDPTENVKALNAAEAKRQDDLRIAAEKLSNVKHGHAKELMGLRANYEEKLRRAEANRLDAIRAVDVAAAQLREERASAAATVLANQVATTASTLRDLVASTATAAATAAAAVTNPIAERVAQLERTSYEGSGKAAVVDPAMSRLAEAVEALRMNMAQGQGGDIRRDNSRANVGMIVGIVGGVGMLLSLLIAAAALFATMNGAG